jgi:hypothetical protein
VSASSLDKIKSGLLDFEKKKNNVINNLIELSKSDYIDLLEGNPKELKGLIAEVLDLFKYSITNSDEMELISFFDEYVSVLLQSAKSKKKQKGGQSSILDLMDNIHRVDSQYFYTEILYLKETLIKYSRLKESFDGLLLDHLRTGIADVNKELVGFRKLRNIADNSLTENIYDQAVIKYRGLEKDYRIYFFSAIGITVGLSLLGLFLKKWLVDNNYLGDIEFWVLKFSILAVGITLITYFLKQSAHYQRLADQNYQTQVELQAYPSFMESIPTEESASVRKELALKYFGREIDSAAHKDMSNLISDQMKSTTEMVKAATDVLKVKG